MTSIEAIRSGDRLSLARLITQVENSTPAGRVALDESFPFAGQAYILGITGAPGTGKSTLVNQLALEMSREMMGGHVKIGIIAIDPTSPFTGGALLGDRVRMRDLANRSGIFIRSMAARGTLGGLARQTAGVVQLLDAAGYDPILIETVGAGQSEVDIARLAHTTLVVEAPGLGDDVQAFKAGLLEAADILVVNKADRPGAEAAARALSAMIEMAPAGPEPAWRPVVRSTNALIGSGIAELLQTIGDHKEYLLQSGERSRRDRVRLKAEFDDLVRFTLAERWRTEVSERQYQAELERLYERQISPQKAVGSLLNPKKNQV